MKRLSMLIAAVLMTVTACSGSSSTTTTAAVVVETTEDSGAASVTTTAGTTPPATTATLPDPGEGLIWHGEHRIPEVLADFALGSVWLDGEELFSGIAETSAQRQQGLMQITDLGDLDGMVFVFEQDFSGGFWMKNTLIPLDIAFFDAGGVFVDGFRMEPCVTDECPSYRPSGSYRYALEMAAGSMPESPRALSLAEPE
jgi:hypothetical protein